MIETKLDQWIQILSPIEYNEKKPKNQKNKKSLNLDKEWWKKINWYTQFFKNIDSLVDEKKLLNPDKKYWRKKKQDYKKLNLMRSKKNQGLKEKWKCKNRFEKDQQTLQNKEERKLRKIKQSVSLEKAQLFLYLLLTLVNWLSFYFSATDLILDLSIFGVISIDGKVPVGLSG